ncbi:MAG: HAD family hydrolase [Bacteroidetes bacterium]|nr:MAG: HAD family hydrolase [Bacteroidota bacterium]
MHKSLLIFDFDGTIADTLRVAIQIVNELGDEFGFRKLNQREFTELKGKSVPELMRLSGLSWVQLPVFIKRARDRFKAYLRQVPPIPHMPEILDTLHKRGYRMGIVTSNTREGVQRFLQTHQLQHFEFIYAPDSLFGKARVLKRILKQHQLAHTEVIMIGDEIRDLEAAGKAGIDALAVTWGFNSEDLLSSGKCAHLVRTPQELLQLFPPRE